MKNSELGRLYKDGEVICGEGEEGNTLYIIQSGSVEVIKNSPDGEISIRTLTAGDIFGEMALFDRMPRSATVRAVGDAKILSIDKKGLMARVSRDPTLAFNILESMSKRIRFLNDELLKLKKISEEPQATPERLKDTCKLILDEIKMFY